MDCLDRPNGITRVLIRERGRQESQRRRCDAGSRGGGWCVKERFEDAIVGFERKGHEPNQRTQEVSRSGKRQESGSPLESPEGRMQCLMLAQ